MNRDIADCYTGDADYADRRSKVNILSKNSIYSIRYYYYYYANKKSRQTRDTQKNKRILKCGISTSKTIPVG